MVISVGGRGGCEFRKWRFGGIRRLSSGTTRSFWGLSVRCSQAWVVGWSVLIRIENVVKTLALMLRSDSRNRGFIELTHAHDLRGSRATTEYFTRSREVEIEGWTFVGWPCEAPSRLLSQRLEVRA
jgi:hypothetical protein